MTIDKEAVKSAAIGRMTDILVHVAGIPIEFLDGRHHPCPNPNCDCGGGGHDRFRYIDSDTGAVLCNQGFTSQNGDFIGTVQWMTGQGYHGSLGACASYLGVVNGSKQRVDLMTEYSRRKGITVESFRAYGARPSKRGKQETIAVPMFDTEGKECGYQDCGLNGALLKGLTNQGGKSGLFLPGGELPSAEQTVYMVEGFKDAARLHAMGLCAVGTPGTTFRAAWARLFRGCRVVLIPDRDKASYKHFERVRKLLDGVAASVGWVDLPFEMREDSGQDVRNLLQQKGGEATFRQLVDEATETASKENNGIEGDTILIGTDETRVIDEGVAALAKHPEVYQRGGILVHVVRDTKPPRGIRRKINPPTIAPMKWPRIEECLASMATWARRTGEDTIESIRPPMWVVKAIDARGTWGPIRPIEGVVEAPALRADGSVLQLPGYDPETGLLFEPKCKFPPIPDRLTKDDAVRAVDALFEVVRDFPFASPEHRAAWLSGLLTPMSRHAYHGPGPFNLIDANTAGSGKSLLADATAMIVAGRDMARMSNPSNDDECRKRILPIALAAEPLVLIDNIAGEFGSPSLDAALTATSWSDRILSKSELATAVPLTCTWYGTGNNVVLVGDTARRTLHIRLESPVENPENRTGFLHPNLLEWVQDNRPRLAVAAVTILAAYCQAGRPNMSLPTWGSYEAWTAIVRSAIVWTGQPDPAATRQQLSSQADIEIRAFRQLIAGWELLDPEGYGLTTSSVLKAIQHADDMDIEPEYRMVRDALQELLPTSKAGGLPSARSIGMKLHHLRKRVINGRYFDLRPDRDGNYWLVRKTAEFTSQDSADFPNTGDCPGTGGTEGTISSISREGREKNPSISRVEQACISPPSPLSPGDDLGPDGEWR